MDNPDSRKLQRQPVPVLGGIAVFFGIVIGYGSVCGMVNYAGMLIVIMAMMVMLYIGTMDDILSLSPALRFAVEFFVALREATASTIFTDYGASAEFPDG